MQFFAARKLILRGMGIEEVKSPRQNRGLICWRLKGAFKTVSRIAA
jgi:hypothetical protein